MSSVKPRGAAPPGRRGRPLALLCLLTLLSAPAGNLARAGSSPYVLLLLDSGGAMNEKSAGGATNCPAERSRWIHVQEALAGTVDDYACVLGAALFPLPIGPVLAPVVPVAATWQNNGLLTMYGNDVRFALMTMDTLPSPSLGVVGDFSYGNNASALLNLGARSPLSTSGGLLSFAAFAEPTTLQHDAKLTRIVRGQEAGYGPIVPHGSDGSLAALLDDAGYFFANDASVTEDPEISCRSRVAFLVASGSSAYDELFDAEGDSSPYRGADDQALELLSQHGVPTFVFYFDNGDPTRRERMNAIAAAGGTSMALPVTDAGSLRQTMAAVTSLLLEGTRSNTQGATTYQTQDSRTSQIQVGAAYTVPPNGGRWYGHVEFFPYRCNAEQAFAVHDFCDILDGEDGTYARQPSRRIVTPLANRLRPLAYSDADPSAGLTPTLLGLVGQTAKAQALVSFLGGTNNATFSREHALGAVVNSSPQVMGPPMLELPFPSYQGPGPGNGKQSFKTRFQDRPTMVYVGADDGLLHGFAVAGRNASAGAIGTEVFAYLPRSLQSKVQSLEFPSVANSFVDGTPIVRDVRLRALSDQPQQEKWITALVGGGRRGGRFYYALNVADPLGLAANPGGNYDGTPYFLWEVDGAAADSDATFRQYLGLAYGRPAIGSVLLQDGEIGVAFLPGGKPVNGLASTGLAFWALKLEPRTDVAGIGKPSIVRSFVSGPATVDPIVDPIVGTPAAYGTLPGQPTTRVYVGDAGGRLWRIDTSDTDPTRWQMRMFHDAYPGAAAADRRPVLYEPALALRPTGEMVIVYGTGDPEDPTDSRNNHKLISLTEQTAVGLQGTSYTAKVNWELTFEQGEQLTAPPTIYDSTVFFGTYRYDSETGACQVGQTRLWGVDYVGNLPDATGDIVPLLPSNSEWAPDRPPSCDESEVEGGGYSKSVPYCKMPSGTRVTGIEISVPPLCEEAFYAAAGAGAGDATGGKPMMTVQTSRYQPVGLLGVPLQGTSHASRLRRSLNQQRVSTMPLMWGAVFDD